MDAQHVETVVLNKTVWEALNGDARRMAPEDADTGTYRRVDSADETDPCNGE